MSTTANHRDVQGLPKDLAKVARQLRKSGEWTVEVTGGNHVRWRHLTCGGVTVTGLTPKPSRAMLYARQLLRHRCRP